MLALAAPLLDDAREVRRELEAWGIEIGKVPEPRRRQPPKPEKQKLPKRARPFEVRRVEVLGVRRTDGSRGSGSG